MRIETLAEGGHGTDELHPRRVFDRESLPLDHHPALEGGLQCLQGGELLHEVDAVDADGAPVGFAEETDLGLHLTFGYGLLDVDGTEQTVLGDPDGDVHQRDGGIQALQGTYQGGLAGTRFPGDQHGPQIGVDEETEHGLFDVRVA